MSFSLQNLSPFGSLFQRYAPQPTAAQPAPMPVRQSPMMGGSHANGSATSDPMAMGYTYGHSGAPRGFPMGAKMKTPSSTGGRGGSGHWMG